jgi:hypothetical protein
MYIWKCHNETSYINYHKVTKIFLLINEGQEGLFWEWVPVGGGRA